MFQNSVFSRYRFLFSLVFALSLLVLIQPKSVSALHSVIPAGNANHYLEVSRSGQGNGLDAPVLYASVYFKSPAGGTVLAFDGNHCAAKPDTTTPVPTRYQLYRAMQDGTFNSGLPVNTVYGQVNQQQTNFNGVPTCGIVSIASPTGLPRSTVYPAYYVAILRVAHTGPDGGGGINAFKLTAANSDGSGAGLGYYSEAGITSNANDPGVNNSFFSLQDRISATNTYSNFTFEFAPPCDYDDTKAGYFKWRDDDWGTLQTNSNFRTKVYEYSRTTNALVRTATFSPRKGNGVFGSQPFLFKKNMKYKWVWENVARSNGVQIYMPFSTAGYDQSCAQAGDAKADCQAGFRGYAFDDDRLDLPINVMVSILENGDSAKQEDLAIISANQPVPDPPFNRANLAAFGVANKGFTQAIPAKYKNGGTHTFVVSAYNSPGTPGKAFTWIAIGSFSCPTVPTISCGSGTATPAIPEPGQSFDIKATFSTSGGTGSGNTNYAMQVFLVSGAGINGAIAAYNQPIPISGGSGEGTISNASIPNAGVYNGYYLIGVSGASNTPLSCPFSVTVANKPYFTVYGGDVHVGSGFGQSCSQQTDSNIIGFGRVGGPTRYAGSSAQLAALALGTIEYFDTGRLLEIDERKSLTFANTNDTGEYGGSFASESAVCAPDLWQSTGGDSLGSSLNLVTSGNGVVRRSGGNLNLSFPGGTGFSNGARTTIYVDGDVMINSNITYRQDGANGSYTDIAQIPSFKLIVRGNIYVHPNVTELNGLFVAMPRDGEDNTGRFYSCGFATNSTTFRAPSLVDMLSCGNGLTVYGSVVADLLKLNRTAGSLRNASSSESWNSGGQPAEKFIYSPEMWLTNGFRSNGDVDSYRTMPPVL